MDFETPDSVTKGSLSRGSVILKITKESKKIPRRKPTIVMGSYMKAGTKVHHKHLKIFKNCLPIIPNMVILFTGDKKKPRESDKAQNSAIQECRKFNDYFKHPVKPSR